MYQCNLVVVTSSNAAFYLRKCGYEYENLEAFRDGRKAYYNYARCYVCEPLVGSKSLAFKAEGKYPYALSVADYRRAIQKESEQIDLAVLKQNDSEFEEKRQELNQCFKRISELKRLRRREELPPIVHDESELYIAPPGAEEVMLQEKVDEMWKDEVFCCALGGTSEKLREKQQRINNCNYHMQEYRYYRRMFSRLLEYDPCIYFTYQDEEEREDFTLVKELRLSELRIGDLAMLCSNDVLKICR